jgi:hypothetical protein
MNPWKRRVRDLVIYILIAIALAAGLVWYATVSGPNGADLFGRWGGLAINTAILFGYLVKDSRRSWHAPNFWRFTITMLFIHLLVFTWILLQIHEWKVLWFFLMYPIEVPLFFFCRNRLNRGQPGRRRRQ